MVVSCCAYNCTERARKGAVFHRFPKNIELRKKWIIATKRKDFVPNEHTRICGKHFLETDYIVHFGQKRLKDGVIPTVFNFQTHLNKTVKIRKPRKQMHLDSESNSLHELDDCPKKSKPNTLTPIPSTSSVSITHETHVSPEVFVSKKSKRNNREPVYFGDFNSNNFKTKEAKKVWHVANRQIVKYKATIRSLRVKQFRLIKRVKTLEDLINHLKTSKRLSTECVDLLQDSISPAQKQMLLRQLKTTTSRKYPEELRTFALTLNFYSNSAYNYVRKIFSNCLPHPKTLLNWYRSIDGSPGYTAETLRAVQCKVLEQKKEGKPLVCSVIMDEMTIRKHIQWNGSRQIGYINYGLGMDSDSLPVAKEALVFLLVAVNCRWKVPIAYFLINGINAAQKASLVNNCLKLLHDIGVVITSLTFDGTATNFSMANILGAKLTNISNLKTFFSHPITKCPIYILLDPCHMIKLIRNCLGDYEILYDGNNKVINWKYFKLLVKLQEDHNLHAATKIRARHLNYYKEKMKVKLAVQTFSASGVRIIASKTTASTTHSVDKSITPTTHSVDNTSHSNVHSV